MSRQSYVYVVVNRETGKFGALLETFRTIRCGMDFAMYLLITYSLLTAHIVPTYCMITAYLLYPLLLSRYPLDKQRCTYMIGSVANKLGLKVIFCSHGNDD